MVNFKIVPNGIYSQRAIAGALLFLVAIIFPLVVEGFIVNLSIEAMFLAIYAMSLGLLIGFTGLISFGHAAFFGGGAYIVAIMLTHITTSFWLAAVIALFAIAAIAAIVGFFSIQQRGIYLAMLTLAFAQLIYLLVYNNATGFTGGSDGISGIPSGNFGIPGVLFIQPEGLGYYYLMLLVILLVYLFIYRVVKSPIGAVFLAIRENENRAKFAGYNTKAYKLFAFVLSGTIAAIGGIFYAPFYSAVTPSLMFWEFSGEGLAMAIIGGMRSVFGPIIGAILFVSTREVVSPVIRDWRIVLGVIFIIFIILQPNGLVAIGRQIQEYAVGKRREDGTETEDTDA